MTTTHAGAAGADPAPRPTPAFLTAALCFGAAAIHLVMAPVHATASQTEAIGFAVAGWFQAAVGVVLLIRPNRRWFAVAAIGNGVILAVWVWSRIRGLPVGENPWQPEAAGGVDITAALFEGGIIVSALVQLLPESSFKLPPVASAISGIAVLVVTTIVLVNPLTADHHGEATLSTGTAAATAQPVSVTTQRCDQSLNPVSYWKEAKWSGADVSLADQPQSTGAATGAKDHHGNPVGAAGTPYQSTPTTLGPLKGRGSPQLDKLIGLSGQSGEAAAAVAVAEMAKANDAEYEEFIKTMNPASGLKMASPTSSSDTEDHSMGHLGPQPWKAMTNPADCDAVRRELDQARAVAARFTTAQSAIDAGYRRVAPYLPGIASHWMKFSLVDGKFNIDEPEMLLYDGNGPDAHIAGLSYYVSLQGDNQPSQGFTGDNDLYHRHLGLCTSRAGGVIGDSTTSEEECKAAGGFKAGGGSGWMSHAWVVPGCESPWGVFSGINPLLDDKLGKASGTDNGGCAGSGVRARYDLRPGTAESMPVTTTTTGARTETASGGG